MPTLNYFCNGKKMTLAPIYLRLSAGRGNDIQVKTGLLVDPNRWSSKTQSIKQRIITDDDKRLISKLADLKQYVRSEMATYGGTYTKQWLTDKISDFHCIRQDSNTLNSYISNYIAAAESGERKGKGGKNITTGTINTWKGFQRIFNEFQGVYTEDRLKELEKEKKTTRPHIILDFEDITVDFYNSFVSFLSDEGYSVNTMGRFIKALKYFMKKSLRDHKHDNKEFMEQAFEGFAEDSFTIYLTEQEVQKIYALDLTKYPRMELARDAFIVLCETALRVSDYSQINCSIIERDGKKLIQLDQKKTGGQVIIPLTSRMKAILNKYNGKLPSIPEQYVNKYIKSICLSCGITEELQWKAYKFGKRYIKSAKKWEMVSCHTGRRTACTLMYLAGIPTIDIMKISGHSSEKAFLRYIRVTGEETAIRLADHPYFSDLKVAK